MIFGTDSTVWAESLQNVRPERILSIRLESTGASQWKFLPPSLPLSRVSLPRKKEFRWKFCRGAERRTEAPDGLLHGRLLPWCDAARGPRLSLRARRDCENGRRVHSGRWSHRFRHRRETR